MLGKNVSLLKSIEIDDSIFQCNPECGEKYLLQLGWNADNEAWQWKVVKKTDVIPTPTPPEPTPPEPTVPAEVTFENPVDGDPTRGQMEVSLGADDTWSGTL